jgi:hypothetical protein
MASIQQWRDRAAPLRHGSMATLLASLVITVFIVPVVIPSESVLGRIVQDLLLSLILLSGVISALDRARGWLILIAPVALAAIVVRWMGWVSPTGLTLAVRDEATLFALVSLCTVIGIKVFGSGTVTQDRIRGAMAFYVLVGVICSVAYQLLSMYVPGAFSGVSAHAGLVDRSTWVYFSFTTLTTVGYGDITPVARAARSLANLEALIGQLYPAIVLARLVSLQVAGGGSGTNKT